LEQVVGVRRAGRPALVTVPPGRAGHGLVQDRDGRLREAAAQFRFRVRPAVPAGEHLHGQARARYGIAGLFGPANAPVSLRQDALSLMRPKVLLSPSTDFLPLPGLVPPGVASVPL